MINSKPVAKLKVATIIFDLDGVLIDSSRDIANAANHTLEVLGLAPLPWPLIAGYIGGGAEPLLRACLGARSAELFDRALPLFKERYAEYCLVETVLYPGVHELLVQCEAYGIPLAVATNKMERITHRICQGLGIAGYFREIVGPERVTRRKPDPEALQIIMRALAACPATTLMIGDTPGDILAGKHAACLTCAVTYGFGTRDELEGAGPDIIINRADALCDYLDPPQ